MSGSESPEAAAQFEALIVPHRSLGRSGLRWVAGSLFALSACVSAGLWLVGAWPVIGFTGLEAALAVWLLQRNARGATGSELLLLTAAGLRIVRTDPRGRRRERRLEGGWLRAVLHERLGRAPALVVYDRGARVEVAAALGEQEKRELAAALNEALHRRRHPVFDNPQLREPDATLRADPST